MEQSKRYRITFYFDGEYSSILLHASSKDEALLRFRKYFGSSGLIMDVI